MQRAEILRVAAVKDNERADARELRKRRHREAPLGRNWHVDKVESHGVQRKRHGHKLHRKEAKKVRKGYWSDNKKNAVV